MDETIEDLDIRAGGLGLCIVRSGWPDAGIHIDGYRLHCYDGQHLGKVVADNLLTLDDVAEALDRYELDHPPDG